MHILLIHQAFTALDEPGGTRHYELSRRLVEYGHRVTVITSPVSYLTGKPRHLSKKRQPGNLSQGPATSNPGIRILEAYAYPALHRSFVHRTLNFASFMVSSLLIGLRVGKLDLVWGTSPPIFQGVTAWVVARLKRVPLLFEVRDLWPAFAVQVGVLRLPALIRASEWLERALYRRADRVMVNSPGFVPYVQLRGAREVTVLPNGADTSMFNPADGGDQFRQANGLAGRTVVLYAGAHGLSNDLGVVLEAANLLRDRDDIVIVLLGDGKEKPGLVAQATRMGLANVCFIDPLPKNEMSCALAGADICLAILKPLPLYATVYPNKVFDYMAAGRPVVLAIAGVIRELLERAGAGIPVAPGDASSLARAIRQLADDPEKRRRMGLAGRTYVAAHFDRANLAEQLNRLLESMLA